ncbi:Phosphate:acyl-ACP acyltransferase PlsX (EC 2.3.1.n2) [hydrothermal vent metagenome]|uniref:phosphate acyltransferase n=1 Tax=hydrothermal vent metagenome TaxID=652676 RepID=A0A3B1BM24_9ZZZZ
MNELPETPDDTKNPQPAPTTPPSDKTQHKDKDDRVKIALDAMGGDNAPAAIVEGACQAADSIDGLEIILVGDENAILSEFEKHPGAKDKLTIKHAQDAISMDESPSVALRKRRKSSIHIGLKMVDEGEADTFISAGNTGAVMAVATVMLRNIEGIDRAAIAVPLPTQKGNAVLLDAGANIVCKAIHLYQFGIMGSMYAQYILDTQKPRIGLLSIGEEDSKGNAVTKEALEMLTQSSVNFIGNIEGKLLYKGAADVIVCDGYTGNIALKISESLAEMIGVELKGIFSRNLRGKLSYMLLRPSMEKFKKKLDHSEVGGAPLLGIDGAVFISHGSSTPKSIRSAILGAKKFIVENVNDHIRESLAQNQDIVSSSKKDMRDGIWSQMKRKIGLGHPDRPEEA